MKYRFLILFLFNTQIIFSDGQLEQLVASVKAKESAQKGASLLVEKHKKSRNNLSRLAHGIASRGRYVKDRFFDATNYAKEFLLYGFDSTRSYNALLARYRDWLKTKYILRTDFDGFERDRDALHTYAEVSDDNLQKQYDFYKKQRASIITDPGLSEDEQRFIEQRLKHINDGLKKFFSSEEDQSFAVNLKKMEKVPRIAVCASGGGFRAMTATAGFIKGLEKTGLLDTVLFMSALSGSSWATFPRAYGIPTNLLIKGYKKYARLSVSLRNGFILMDADQKKNLMAQAWQTEDCDFPERDIMRDNFLRKFYFEQPLDSITFFGDLIGHMVLAPFDDPTLYRDLAMKFPQPRQRVLLSQLKMYLEKDGCADFPLPIATAVTPLMDMITAARQKAGNDLLHWIEFTPYAIGTRYVGADMKTKGAFVPVWAFNRKFAPEYESAAGFFSKGEPIRYVSQDYAPEMPLGNLLGIWGSAFTFSFRDLIRILGFDHLLGDGSFSFGTIFKTVIDLGMKIAHPFGFFKDSRFLPATVHNFFESLPDSPFVKRTLTLVDAGIAFNLPLPPLLEAERGVDIILIMDASANVFHSDSKGQRRSEALEKAAEWARVKGIPFPQIKGSAAYAKAVQFDLFDNALHPVTVFKGTDGAPTLIYIPLVDTQKTRTTFSIEKCMQESCKTTSFNYKNEEIEGIANHMETMVITYLPIIKEAIKDHFTEG